MFEFNDNEALGRVISVDTSTVTIRVDDLERLRRIQVNRLTVLQSSRAGQHLIGVVTRITRRAEDEIKLDETADSPIDQPLPENNLVKISLIGTMLERRGEDHNVFLRTLETVPDIEANCFPLEGKRLTEFMQVISSIEADGARLSLGKFTLDEEAEALLNGNKLFQRHAVIVGSTGSGKSFTTARLLDQIAQLPQANVIVFDIHGEYKPLEGEEFRHLRIAGPDDVDNVSSLSNGILHLPYWLLGYEALVSIFVDRSDLNAPNQTMVMMNCITDAKRSSLTNGGHHDLLQNFTIDSPVPFDIEVVLTELSRLNVEMVPGAYRKAGSVLRQIVPSNRSFRGQEERSTTWVLISAAPRVHGSKLAKRDGPSFNCWSWVST